MEDLENQDMAAIGPRVEEEEKESLLEGMSALDFDVLCTTVALQTQQGKWRKLEGIRVGGDGDGEGSDFGGVLRMWEGELLDVFDDRRIALESAWFVSLSLIIFLTNESCLALQKILWKIIFEKCLYNLDTIFHTYFFYILSFIDMVVV